MSQEDPIIILVMILASAYLGWLYLNDLKSHNAGTPNTKAFPGATRAPLPIIITASLGAVAILTAETYGEYFLEIKEEQTSISWLFLLSMIAAAFMEELIFRGYFVITEKGKAYLLLSVFGFSFLFAIIHPYLWEWEDSFKLVLSSKALFSTSIVFINSLWFYYMRVTKWNPNKSLIPCISAHLSSNLGVFAIKYAQGFVKGLY